MTKYQDHAQTVAAQLINAITTDTTGGVWQAPWHHNGSSVWAPRNATTGNSYRGGNTIGLAIRALDQGYTSGDWSTFRQWTSIGAQVTKGQRGTRCVRWVRTKPKDQDTTGTADEQTSRMVPTLFTLFNADQVDGYDPHTTNPQPLDSIEAADADIKATGAVILHGGDKAFYRPASDVIQLPDRNRFTSTAGFYGTCLHELGHWTSAPQRCDRQLGERYGDAAYAVEELTAELTAAILTARYGMANQARADHATYIGSWLRLMGEKPEALLSVANQAQAAADFILSTSPANTIEGGGAADTTKAAA